MGSRVLEGQVAFITGGGGGIARATASYLLQDGAAVLLMDCSAEALEASEKALRSRLPDAQIETHLGDAGDPLDVQEALAKARGIAGRLDMLIPTVGGGAFMPILMHDGESFRRQIDLNVMTAFLAIRYGVPMMTQGGAVVCISSTVAKLPFAWLSAYCTAKGALEQFVRVAADELASAGVRVNAVRPGVTRTEMARSMFETSPIMNAFLEQIPLGRGGEPEEVARAVRFLAGPESAWTTGQSFAVDGGNELRRNPDLTPIVAGQSEADAQPAGR